MRYRGQNAVEYMMTYGWALLIILVVGIAVWQMGFLRLSGNINPDKSGFSQLTPLDWSLGENGVFTVVVQNNAGTIVTLDPTETAAILLANGNGACGSPTFNPAGNDLRPADTKAITFPTCSLTSADAGEYYRINLTIRYVNQASELPHKSNGLIWGPLG